MKLAEMTLNSTYREALIANAANIATGQNLLPLPQLKARTYTAQEIGDMLGISANKVGRLANANGLKTSEYGDWFADKAKNADKEVQTFRYYGSVTTRLREIMGGAV